MDSQPLGSTPRVRMHAFEGFNELNSGKLALRFKSLNAQSFETVFTSELPTLVNLEIQTHPNPLLQLSPAHLAWSSCFKVVGCGAAVAVATGWCCIGASEIRGSSFKEMYMLRKGSLVS